MLLMFTQMSVGMRLNKIVVIKNYKKEETESVRD